MMSPMLVGLVGRAGAGKDTVAEVLVARHGFRRMAFADKLKEILSDAFDVPIEHFSDRGMKNVPHSNLCAGYISRKFSGKELVRWFESVFDDLAPVAPRVPFDIAASAIFHNILPDGAPVSPRVAAQLIGVEGFRAMLGDSVWVDYVMRQAHASIGHGVPVVISDVRFEDEFDAVCFPVNGVPGQMVGIRRPGGEEIHRHASEDQIGCLVARSGIVILNDGSIDSLRINADYLVTNRQKLRYRMEVARYREIIRTLASGVQAGMNMSQQEELFVQNLFGSGQMSRIGFLSDREKQWLDDIWARASNDETKRSSRPRAA